MRKFLFPSKQFKIILLIISSILITNCTTVEANNENLISASTRSSAQSIQQDQSLIVYLVRHAEKENDGTNDPALTLEGKARAQALANLLRGVSFTQIHSTDYKRTRDTALPVLANSNLNALTFYNGRDLETLASSILTQGGTHLVVGHSNTTNEVAQALSDLPGYPLTEKNYNRLYIVTRKDNDETSLSIVHFDAHDFDLNN